MPPYFWAVIEVQAPRVIFTDLAWFGGLHTTEWVREPHLALSDTAPQGLQGTS